MRKITQIVIHCSATPEGKAFTAADIDRWHRERGFNRIGYHFVVGLDGSIQTGRDIADVGAHVAGHNANSIGIVYIGGLAKDGKTPKDTRTPAQKEAIRHLVDTLKGYHPGVEVLGHRDFHGVAKACPSFDVKTQL